MSILTTSPETPAQRISRLLIESTQQTRDVLLGQLRHTTDLLASAPDPQAVFDTLGPAAGAILAEASALSDYASARLTANEDTAGLEALEAIVARIPPVEVDAETGLVTIITPEPEPEE